MECSLRPKIKTAIEMEATVLESTKEAGGTADAMMQILTGCTMAEHTSLTQMEFAGSHLGDCSIH